MLCKLSILNTKTNKLLVLNNTHISSKLFSTIPSKGKPTWRITYNEDDEDSEYNDMSTNQKSFGNVTINNVTPKKKEFTMSSKSSNNLKINNNLSNSKIELPNKNTNKKQISKKGKTTKQIITYNNPEFEIIKSTNSESVLFAKMNPNSLFYAKYGTVVGLSSKVRIELSYEDNTDEVLKGGNGSGIFAFEKVWTESNPGQVLLVPVKGDLMLINVKKGKEYVVKGKSLFGAVSSISVNDYYHNNHKFEGVKYFIVRGKGTIAIEGEGGVLEITLNEDEHFLVKPSTLLAFESQMSVKPVLSSACTEEIEEDVLEKQDNNDSSFWKKAKGMIDRAKVYVSGDQLFYRLKGPGKFYISTRIPSLSGLQAFKLNNKDKKISNKTIQKRNYSTNSRRPQALDDYEPELENEISTLQKKLMEKTLNKQISKKSNKRNKKTVSKKQLKNERYPDTSNQFNEENNELYEESQKPYQSVIDEKAVLYKKSDKVKSPKSAMFFTSRESTEETNIEKSLIKTPKKNSIDVYLDEDVGEALIRENNRYKNNKFSLSSHQNQNLKSIINSEVKENKDRSINTMLEKRTAEIKAEQKRKRQQELNPKRYIEEEEEEEDNNEEDVEENEDVEEEIIDENEDEFEDNEDKVVEDEVEDEVEEIEEEEEEEEEEPEPKSKKFNKKQQKKQNKKIKKIVNEPEETEKKTWVMKENIKENKFFTFDDKNPMTIPAISKTKKSNESDSSFKSSLKKKSTTKKLKKSSNLSKQSNSSTGSFKRNHNKVEKVVSKKNQRKSINKPSVNKKSISSKGKPSQKVIVKKTNSNNDDYFDDNEKYINENNNEEIIEDEYDVDDEVVDDQIEDEVVEDDEEIIEDENEEIIDDGDEYNEDEEDIADEEVVDDDEIEDEDILDENEEYIEEEDDNDEYVENEDDEE